MKKRNIKLAGLFVLILCLATPACSAGGKNEFQQTRLTGPIGDFAITSPDEGETFSAIRPVVKWEKAANAECYDVEVSSRGDFNFSDPDSFMLRRQGIVGEKFMLSGELDWERVLYVRVRARNADADKLSEPVMFITDEGEIAEDDVLLDDFSGYANSAELAAVYAHSGGDPAGAALSDAVRTPSGNKTMRIDYDFRAPQYGYSIFTRSVKGSFHGTGGLSFWIRSDSAEPINFGFDLVEKNGAGFRTGIILYPNRAELLRIPFSLFRSHQDAGTLMKDNFEPRNLAQIRILTGGAWGTAHGDIYIGDFCLYIGEEAETDLIDDFEGYNAGNPLLGTWFFDPANRGFGPWNTYVEIDNGTLAYSFEGGQGPRLLEKRVLGALAGDTLCLRVRNEGGRNTVGIRFFLGAGYAGAYYTYVLYDLPDVWQEIKIPLADFYYCEDPLTMGGFTADEIMSIALWVSNDNFAEVYITWFDDIRIITVDG